MPGAEAKPTAVERRPSDARERILETAYELFSQHGIRAVGVDAVVERAGVAKMTLYRHFESKDELGRAIGKRRVVRRRSGSCSSPLLTAEDGASR